MTLRQDVKGIFDELDEEDVTILGIIVAGSALTPYDVWKQAKEIPQRTVYEKIERLVEAKYIVKGEKQKFKRKLARQLCSLTLRGMLAALAYEKLSLEGSLINRFRTELHIPERFEKAVKPVISIWAYRESRVSKSERGKIDADSIFESVLELCAAWKDIGSEPRSILGMRLELPSVAKFREELGITDEEYKILNNFVSAMLAFRLPEKMELKKRILSYSSGVAPIPWLADCIEIPPYFAIRMFWSASEYRRRAEISNFLSWFLMHKNIATLVSQGDVNRLNQYLKESASKLRFSWRPICLKREYDGMCTIKNVECPHDSLLECEIVRENAKKFEEFLNFIIEKWAKF
jgi:hypothetical protein